MASLTSQLAPEVPFVCLPAHWTDDAMFTESPLQIPHWKAVYPNRSEFALKQINLIYCVGSQI